MENQCFGHLGSTFVGFALFGPHYKNENKIMFSNACYLPLLTKDCEPKAHCIRMTGKHQRHQTVAFSLSLSF